MAKHDHIDNRQSVKYKVIKTAAYSGLHCLGLTNIASYMYPNVSSYTVLSAILVLQGLINTVYTICWFRVPASKSIKNKT